MLAERERNYGLGRDAAGPRMLLEHERNYGLGMDALVIACSWNTNGIMFLASLYSARRGVGGLNPTPQNYPAEWNLAQRSCCTWESFLGQRLRTWGCLEITRFV